MQEPTAPAGVEPDDRVALGSLADTLAEPRSDAESLAAEVPAEVAALERSAADRTTSERYRAALAERIVPVSLIDRGTGELQRGLAGQRHRRPPAPIERDRSEQAPPAGGDRRTGRGRGRSR